jgi:hypothetical protein
MVRAAAVIYEQFFFGSRGKKLISRPVCAGQLITCNPAAVNMFGKTIWLQSDIFGMGERERRGLNAVSCSLFFDRIAILTKVVLDNRGWDSVPFLHNHTRVLTTNFPPES